MQTTTKTVLMLSALALLALPTAVDAATAVAATPDSDARVYCYDLPQPLTGPWRTICGILSDVCRKTDLCR